MQRIIMHVALCLLAAAEASKNVTINRLEVDHEGHTENLKDETSLIQKKINIHKKAATADKVTASVTYCRIIGPGSGVEPAADTAAQGLLLANKCTQIDWDGDPLEKPSGERAGNFAGALRGIKEKGEKQDPPLAITLTPHCTLSDCGAKTDVNGKDITNADGSLVNEYGEDQARAIEVRVNGGPYTAPGVVPVGATAPDQNDDVNAETGPWTAAEASVKAALPKALESANPDNNFKKYTTLAVADVQLLATLAVAESENILVIWLVDTERPVTPLASDPGKTFGAGYWNWVSLAEYLIFPQSGERTYKYVNSRTGAEIPQADIDSLSRRITKEAMGVSPPISG